MRSFAANPGSNNFNDLIKSDNSKGLKKYLDSFSSITLEDALNGLLLAAHSSAWSCIAVILDYSKRIYTNEKNTENFKYGLGKVVMLAVKANQTDVVESLLSFHILNHYHSQFARGYRKLFYRDSNHTKSSTDIMRDTDNQFSFLHWAVKNNNPRMCELLLTAWNQANVRQAEIGTALDHIGCISLCKVKDQNDQTSYALAISLGHLDCAKAIAKFHDWGFVRDHESDEIIFKTMLHNIHFGYYKFSNYNFFDFHTTYLNLQHNAPFSIAELNKRNGYNQWASDKTRRKYFEMVLSRSDAEKVSYFNQAMDKETALGSLYAAGDPYTDIEMKERLKSEFSALAAGDPKDIGSSSLFRYIPGV